LDFVRLANNYTVLADSTPECHLTPNERFPTPETRHPESVIFTRRLEFLGVSGVEAAGIVAVPLWGTLAY
jgi:hypothetical protein